MIEFKTTGPQNNPTTVGQLVGLLCFMLFLQLGLDVMGEEGKYRVPIPPQEQILSTLKKEHPRLYIPTGEERKVIRLLKEEPPARKIFQAIKTEADDLLKCDTKPVYYRDTARPLSGSMEFRSRMTILATAWRLTNERQYADRAWKDLQVAAAFPNWCPTQFRDTAEMTFAFALCYDWLYPAFKEEQKDILRSAIVQKGLLPGKAILERQSNWWPAARGNLNIVCCSALVAGALAVADETPELAASIIRQSCLAVQNALGSFQPDGAWFEGPDGWNLACNATVFLFSALDSALGTDFHLSTFPGFDRCPDFRMANVGPLRKDFNFGDNAESISPLPAAFWLSHFFKRPELAFLERDMIGGHTPWHLWWYDGTGTCDLLSHCPEVHFFRGINAAYMRTSWTNHHGAFLAIKGGDNRFARAHLDLGTFIYDAMGVRWFVELGPDSNPLPDYYGKKRSIYYRTSTKGQNTLVIDDQSQNPLAMANIRMEQSPNSSIGLCAIDLKDAYSFTNATQITRKALLTDSGQLVIEDELVHVHANQILWQVHTEAEIVIDPADSTRARLQQNGQTLLVQVESEPRSGFHILSAIRTQPECTNAGIAKLAIRITPEETRPVRIKVTCTPQISKE